MSIVVKQISYIHPNGELLFNDLSFSLSKGQKIALIGNNGTGKSKLLQMIAGHAQWSSGEISCGEKPCYVPQHFGQYDELTVAAAIGIDDKLKALQSIIDGDASAENFSILNDDWTIEEKAFEALNLWGINEVALTQPLKTLSGGQKTKVFLAGITINSPSFILLDEPSNHLDTDSRRQLYDLIRASRATLIVVSHDRSLLNILDTTYELKKGGLELYGGNYDFYLLQKEEKFGALKAQFEHQQKTLRQAKQTAREAAERKQKENSRGNKKQSKKGLPQIVLNMMKNGAEQSTSKLNGIHNNKIDGILNDLEQVRQQLPETKELAMNFENANLHTGKILITAEQINFGYNSKYLWEKPLSFQIRSGDKIVINGKNGSGKTTLLKLMLGQIKPTAGTIELGQFNSVYIDQEYSLISNTLTVFEQLQAFNKQSFPDFKLKTLLHQFLFSSNAWDKTCSQLSGGEKVKLLFCCLRVADATPDVIILDEPTNNLDIRSLEIITAAIKSYKGTLLVISHDQYFRNEVGIEQEIELY